MMLCTLVFAADMAAGLTVVVVKNLRRNEMVGDCMRRTCEMRVLEEQKRVYICSI